MKLETIRGTASDVHGVEVWESDDRGRMTSGTKTLKINFRLGAKRVVFSRSWLILSDSARIDDGDEIVAVGKYQKDGKFWAMAIRNDTKEEEFFMPFKTELTFSILTILLGIPLILIYGLGFLVIYGGVRWMKLAFAYRDSAAMLRTTS
jgi:hypothetical protein